MRYQQHSGVPPCPRFSIFSQRCSCPAHVDLRWTPPWALPCRDRLSPLARSTPAKKVSLNSGTRDQHGPRHSHASLHHASAMDQALPQSTSG